MSYTGCRWMCLKHLLYTNWILLLHQFKHNPRKSKNEWFRHHKEFGRNIYYQCTSNDICYFCPCDAAMSSRQAVLAFKCVPGLKHTCHSASRLTLHSGAFLLRLEALPPLCDLQSPWTHKSSCLFILWHQAGAIIFTFLFSVIYKYAKPFSQLK